MLLDEFVHVSYKIQISCELIISIKSEELFLQSVSPCTFHDKTETSPPS